ncbi:hypothetical protein NDU88_005667 [Pleurodeles waltl]|uniref:Uncharacterized protein n=1 Tax=Pleurodeles waltl TaxID=8319 RepID=A0AAV7MB78_PLEWA|nr:hypothetical protein NDU88_005667 [Pleurodeles waltl]
MKGKHAREEAERVNGTSGRNEHSLSKGTSPAEVFCVLKRKGHEPRTLLCRSGDQYQDGLHTNRICLDLMNVYALVE